MAKYMKKEMADLNGTGQMQAYYCMQRVGNISHSEFVSRCAYSGSGLARSTVEAVLTVVGDMLPHLLAHGYSVSIDGLGTFAAKLGVREDKEQDAFEPGEPTRNAQSIEVSGIGFRTDKRLVHKTGRQCTLERGGVSRLQRSEYTLDERMALARDYLEHNAYMRVGNYAALTGLSHSKACAELRRLSQLPDSGFVSRGSGTHKVYVKCGSTIA